jgi:hypothetical protein
VLLLDHLIRMWDINDQLFNVGPHTLDIEMEEIHFLMGLFNQGAMFILVSHRGTEISIKEYIIQYYREGTRKSSGKIPIEDITNCPLCIILFTITNLVGSTRSHLSSKYLKHIWHTLLSVLSLNCSIGWGVCW